MSSDTLTKVTQALQDADGNRALTARRLGISRGSLYRLLQKLPKEEVPPRYGVVLSDTHIPGHDPVALGAACAFIKRTQPDIIHLLGDIGDWYTLSRFDKSPNRKDELWKDSCKMFAFLTLLRELAPEAELRFSEGNHEARIRRYLNSNARELTSLPFLTVPYLLGLQELGISFYPTTAPYRVGHLLFLHGDHVRKHAGDTARAHFEKWGCSLIVGHCHREGSYTVRRHDEVYKCWENPCLCRLEDVEYDNHPNWHQGWSAIWHAADGRFHVEPVSYIRGAYNYQGKTYTDALKLPLAMSSDREALKLGRKRLKQIEEENE